jgi:YcxB-like protein
MYLRVDAPDSSRYAAALRHVGRRARLQVRLIGVTLVGLGLLLALAGNADARVRLGYLVVGLVVALLGGMLLFAPARGSTARLSAAAAQPCSFELTDGYVRQNSTLHTSQLAWAAFERLEEIPGQLLLFTAKGQFISVPIGGLDSEQLAELRGFITGRGVVRF